MLDRKKETIRFMTEFAIVVSRGAELRLQIKVRSSKDLSLTEC